MHVRFTLTHTYTCVPNVTKNNSHANLFTRFVSQISRKTEQ